jgi:PTH1 family peptidyl-tRNA hydrolase
MKLIVGLGNPGEKYRTTRHNLGWMVIDELVNEFESQGLKLKNFSFAQVYEGRGFLLAKPKAFMNNSGASVKELITNYQLPTFDFWLIHDDIDLPLGKLKIVKNKGSAGHKGVMSAIRELGTVDFVRFRLGISHPRRSRKMVGGKRIVKYDSKEDLEEFVLAPFLPTEQDEVKNLIEKTVKAIKLALEQGIEAAMNRYN